MKSRHLRAGTAAGICVILSLLAAAGCGMIVVNIPGADNRKGNGGCALETTRRSFSDVLPNGLRLVSETVERSPNDRSRTLLGVLEKVEVKLSQPVQGIVRWSVSSRDGTDAGTLIEQFPGSAIYMAPISCTRSRVTATFDLVTDGRRQRASLSLDFDVIRPTGVSFEQIPGSVKYHHKGFPSVGAKVNIYLTPENVSFMGLTISEGHSKALVTGYYVKDSEEKPDHQPSARPAPMQRHVPGKGTMVGADDQICSGDDQSRDYEDGSFIWDIPWYYGDGVRMVEQPFDRVIHQKIITPDGTVTLTKSNLQSRGRSEIRLHVSAKVDEADSGLEVCRRGS